MGKRLDHNRVTRAKAKKALATDDRNTSTLSDRELLDSAYKDAFRQDYHATKHSLTRGRRNIAAERQYERDQKRVDTWLAKHTGNKRKP